MPDRQSAFLTADLHGVSREALRDLHDYTLGEAAAICLLRGCEVFAGKISSIGELRKEVGESDDDRAVFARTIAMESVEQLYPEQRIVTSGLNVTWHKEPIFHKSGFGPWNGWAGIDIQIGAELLFFRQQPSIETYGTVPHYGSIPVDITVVATDKGLITRFREIVEIHRNLLAHPDSLTSVLSTLPRNRNLILGAYAVRYLARAPSTVDWNHSAALQISLIEDESVQYLVRRDLINWLKLHFSNLSPSSRQQVTQSLMDLGGRDLNVPDSNIDFLALDALIWYARFDLLDMLPFLNPDLQSRLVRNYRQLIGSENSGADKANNWQTVFERELGIR